ncbi:unnamed protein product [Caenorhabditis nigoni]
MLKPPPARKQRSFTSILSLRERSRVSASGNFEQRMPSDSSGARHGQHAKLFIQGSRVDETAVAAQKQGEDQEMHDLQGSHVQDLEKSLRPKEEELPQKVAMRAVRAVDLFKAYKKANHIGEIWRTLDAAKKEEWDQWKAQLLKEFLEQLQKGFIYTREDGEPANKAPRAANGEEAEYRF